MHASAAAHAPAWRDFPCCFYSDEAPLSCIYSAFSINPSAWGELPTSVSRCALQHKAEETLSQLDTFLFWQRKHLPTACAMLYAVMHPRRQVSSPVRGLLQCCKSWGPSTCIKKRTLLALLRLCLRTRCLGAFESPTYSRPSLAWAAWAWACRLAL